MSISSVIKASGLNTSANFLNSTGALDRAENVVCRQPDTYQPRRGQYAVAGNIGSSSNIAPSQVFELAGFIYVQLGSELYKYDPTNTTSPFTVVAPTGLMSAIKPGLCRLAGVATDNNLFISSSSGLYVLDGVTNLLSPAGTPQALTGNVCKLLTLGYDKAGSCTLPGASIIGYKSTILQYDGQGKPHEGAPSGPIYVRNPSWSANDGSIIKYDEVLGTSVVQVKGVSPEFLERLEVYDTIIFDESSPDTGYSLDPTGTLGSQTITFTNGSTTVTGVGTTFSTLFAKTYGATGLWIRPKSSVGGIVVSNMWVCIASIGGATTATLRSAWTGDTVTCAVPDCRWTYFPGGEKTITQVNTTDNYFTYEDLYGNGAGILQPINEYTINFYRNANPTLSFTIPDSARDGGSKLRVYRTQKAAYTQTSGTGDYTGSPDDSYSLVYEKEISATLDSTVVSSWSKSGGNVLFHQTVMPLGQYSSIYVTDIDSGLPGGAKKIYLAFSSLNNYFYQDNDGATVATTGTFTISTKDVFFTDNTADSMRGLALYTNGEYGAALAAYEPPLATHSCFWNNRLWLADIKDKHKLSFNLFATDSVANDIALVAGDTFIVGGRTYTARADWNTNGYPTDFPIYYQFSATRNIEKTAQALCNAINSDIEQTEVYAQYIGNSTTGLADLGKIQLVAKSLTTSQFNITSSKQNAWVPALPSSGRLVLSADMAATNGIWWSTASEFESFPLGNTELVTSNESNILKIVGLRDNMFIFTTRGLYSLYQDSSGGVSITQADTSIKLLAPDSVVVIDNTIYCLCTMGIVSISSGGGKSFIGWPIGSNIKDLILQDLAFIGRIAFGVGYEGEREYWLWLPSSAADTYATVAYIYNIFTGTFTTATGLNRSCGIVKSVDNVLYTGSATTNKLCKERNSGSVLDYQDDEVSVTISSNTGTTLTLASVFGVEVGDYIEDGAYHSALISAVNTSTRVVTVDHSENWTNGSGIVYKHFVSKLVFNPWTAGNPAVNKQVSELIYTFNDFSAQQAYATVSNETNRGTIAYPVYSTQNFLTIGYGLDGGYGVGVYGSGSNYINHRIPTIKGNAGMWMFGFYTAQARAYWELISTTVNYNSSTTTVSRGNAGGSTP